MCATIGTPIAWRERERERDRERQKKEERIYQRISTPSAALYPWGQAGPKSHTSVLKLTFPNSHMDHVTLCSMVITPHQRNSIICTHSPQTYISTHKLSIIFHTFTSEVHRSLPIPSPYAAQRHRRAPRASQQYRLLEDLLFIYLA